jgi:asparagine synthase (glutamine-hydrolysing)
MCGICGILAPNGAAADAAAVDAMRAALVHRGPDEGGTWIDGRCALGIQRLRVVDLLSGQQPVTDESGRITVVMNGELYNFRELRERLGAHEIRGTGDTAVLPHLYEEHGERFAEHLEGMFAIALWDADRERLLLARDRLGKKPLLWTRLADGTVAFGSELKALLQLPELRRDVDLRALDAYLALQYVPGRATALRGVERVPPAHVLVLDAGERLVRYWTPAPQEDATRTDDEWIELVRETVTAAVRKRLIADVPLGALLSGGIDSSVVVSAMAQATAEPVRTFSVGFADPRYDERRLARAVAHRWGTRHEELLVEPDLGDLLPRLARTLDEPFGDSSALPTYVVSEYARRTVTVALTGDGGDESFGGYDRYRAMQLARALDVLPRRIPRTVARLLRGLPRVDPDGRGPVVRAARFLETARLEPAVRYAQLMEVFPSSLRGALWTDEALAELGGVQPTHALLGAPRGAGLRGLQLLDLETYLPSDLLVKADLMSMACSLELRSPLLDHHVVELGLALPDRLKTTRSAGKVALRRAFAADLPPEVLAARKRGFGVPIGRWFRGELRDLAHDVLLDRAARGRGLFRPDAVASLLAQHESGRADHGARIWSLVMLELWQREHVHPAGARAHAVLSPT